VNLAERLQIKILGGQGMRRIFFDQCSIGLRQRSIKTHWFMTKQWQWLWLNAQGTLFSGSGAADFKSCRRIL
jgi:hypothetical protein